MFFHFVKIIFAVLWISSILMMLEVKIAVAAPNIASLTFKEAQGRELVNVTSNSNIKVLRHFMLPSPNRLVIDVERVGNNQVAIPLTSDNSIIKIIRFGHFNETTSRIVLELRQDNNNKVEYHVTQASKSFAIQVKGNKQIKAANTPVNTSISNASASNVPSLPPSTSIFAPIPRSKPNNQTTHMRNANLPIIVIDAGHGGKDPGAIAGIMGSKTYEKNITLRYALHLRNHLNSLNRYNVVMTRSSDEFIFLHDRVKIARVNHGDLFISIHADTAAEKAARGISVYTVSEQSSDSEADILAQQENATDAIGGIKFADDNPEVADILIDLASRDARIKATNFALTLVKNFQTKRLHLLRNPNRFAGFRVLKSPDIPSVLIEVGFLSNPIDEILLNTNDHMQQISTSIAASIAQYLQQHHN